jgi:hypothetical protein
MRIERGIRGVGGVSLRPLPREGPFGAGRPVRGHCNGGRRVLWFVVGTS